ncbi:MAG: DUF3858 domain-containing protein [Saprospiraceae bacterium]
MKFISFLVLFIILQICNPALSQVETYITIESYSVSYTIFSLTDMEQKVIKKYIIHSAKGAQEADLIIPYDKYSKITDADFQYTTLAGPVSKKFKLRDFSDLVLTDGFSLFSDNRMKVIQPKIDVYPVVIEYSYIIKHKNVLGLKPWIPQSNYHMMVQHAELLIKNNLPEKVSIKEINFKGANTEREGVKVWSVDSMMSVKYEQFSPEVEDTRILISPSVIEVDGYHGNLTDWRHYGQWVNGLIQDRDILTAEDQAKIQNLIPPNASVKSKIEILYHYLQNNTRYVSIQLGIGGFQPMPAVEVAKVGYGDCKALSNYMKALLKCIHIDSYYTEIGNGSRKIRYADFPSFFQTNHVVLTVPLEKDTTFLECTSQFFPPGYIGSSNSDRYAMMATANGGQLIRTPVYNQEINRRLVSAQIHVTPDGNAQVSLNTLHSGEYYEAYSDFSFKSKKEQDDELRTLHQGVDFAVDSFKFNFDFASTPVFTLSENLTCNKYASVSGARIFIPLHIIQRYKPEESADSTRMSDIEINSALTEYDSVSIEIPVGYGIEVLPKSFELNNLFGKISSRIEWKNEKIVVVNQFVLYKNAQPKLAYAQLSELLTKAYKSTQSKIVLKKMTP